MVASGNGGQHNDNCNYDGYANSIYTVTIGSDYRGDSVSVCVGLGSEDTAFWHMYCSVVRELYIFWGGVYLSGEGGLCFGVWGTHW